MNMTTDDDMHDDAPEQDVTPPQPNPIADAILRTARERGADKTFCPSEIAREMGGKHPDGWGPLMTPIRRTAVSLALEGKLAIYRKGKKVDPNDFKGVYRLGMTRDD